MRLILDDTLYDEIWNTVKRKFNYPKGFSCNQQYKVFKLEKYIWNEFQESIVNEMFKCMGNDEIYALDWNHDCFVFKASDNIPVNTSWHDEERKCNVYFPTYYPDGDYHAFVSTDFTYGIFGYPWTKEIYVVGENLINLFNKNISGLDLHEKK